MSKREFRFTEGSSNKFWTISLEENKYTVRFGKIGTAGQTQTKEFSNEAEAKKAYEKLVAEKTKKGYVEVKTGDTAEQKTEHKVATKKTSENAEEQSGKKKKVTEAKPIVEEAQIPSTPILTELPTDIPRTIRLDQKDYFWALWRKPEALPKPELKAFDREEAMARLEMCGEENKYYKKQGKTIWIWNWSKVVSDLKLTKEEVHFWLAAIKEINASVKPTSNYYEAKFPSPDNMLKRMSKWKQTENITLDDATQILQSGHYQHHSMIIYLFNKLFSPTDFIKIALKNEEVFNANANAYAYYSDNWSFADTFRERSLPYLNEDERESLRRFLFPEIDLSEFSTDHYNSPPVAICFAAMLGMGKELKPLVESWPNDFYAKEDWHDHYHRPQEIIFGLDHPALVETEMRRLKLKLKEEKYARAWLAHTELAALDVIRDSIAVSGNKDEAQELMDAFCIVEAPEVAPQMLELMLSSKASKGAREWLEKNLTYAVAGLTPLAAERGKLAEAAANHVGRLARRGYAKLVLSAIEREKPERAERLREIVFKSAENLAPFDETTTLDWLKAAVSKVSLAKKVASWITVSDLPPVAVGNNCLNENQANALLIALQQSALQKPHELVHAIKQHGEKNSLDAFVWSLFETWLAEGAPSKEKWAMNAIGLLGGDNSVLKLTPMIREWPGQNQHQRAGSGLEILRAVGSDMALMQINGIAQKLKFKGLKAKAQECMEAIAADRNLTRPELEDRIVPTCDLNERGTRIFDFGPRQFRVVLNQELKPMIRDEAGKVKDNLPKPTTKDDANLAEQATAEWKLLKKQLALVAKTQAERLEQAMVSGRRWTTSEFEELLVKHPLMTNLTRLLVWGGYDEKGKPVSTFRVSEDKTYANESDDAFELKGVSTVGIVHPAHLSERQLAQWGELLGDYEIIPPFAQLGRRIYRLEQGEIKAKEITRFKGVKIDPKVLVFGLDNLAWQRGVPEDGGIFCEYSKPFYGANVTAVVQFDGVPIGYYDGWDDQEIQMCFFVPGIYTPKMYPLHKNAIELGKIDSVVISEVLKDLSALAAKGK
jgi:predicted DNA-binding WGR domain protein